MTTYICTSKGKTIEIEADTIVEAHKAARGAFGENVSFSVKEKDHASVVLSEYLKRLAEAKESENVI